MKRLESVTTGQEKRDRFTVPDGDFVGGEAKPSVTAYARRS